MDSLGVDQNSEDPSGSVRDITHHVIHDSKTSTLVPCIVLTKNRMLTTRGRGGGPDRSDIRWAEASQEKKPPKFRGPFWEGSGEN